VLCSAGASGAALFAPERVDRQRHEDRQSGQQHVIEIARQRRHADHTEQDRALTSVFVLFLLARLGSFREAVRFADLMTWLDERADRLDEDTQQLYHMASLDDPAKHTPSPAIEAIAA